MSSVKSLLLAVAATAGLASHANAAVILVMGDNSLTTQIHLDPDKPDNGTTVYGLTKPGDVSVSFQSDTSLHATGGSGYAQISDFTPDDAFSLDNLAIFLTDGDGFTGYEFTIQYDSGVVGRNTPAYLTVGYDLLGGGSGSFTFNAADPVLENLRFTNPGALDFRLIADGGDIISKLYLISSLPYDQVKQNDIVLANAPPPPVPEPATWAMMIIGFGTVGAAMRRSRKPLAAFA